MPRMPAWSGLHMFGERGSAALLVFGEALSERESVPESKMKKTGKGKGKIHGLQEI